MMIMYIKNRLCYKGQKKPANENWNLVFAVHVQSEYKVSLLYIHVNQYSHCGNTTMLLQRLSGTLKLSRLVRKVPQVCTS